MNLGKFIASKIRKIVGKHYLKHGNESLKNGANPDREKITTLKHYLHYCYAENVKSYIC